MRNSVCSQPWIISGKGIEYLALISVGELSSTHCSNCAARALPAA